ncbi:MAG TPA: SRPBCC family protein [Caulobacteraceae bacterium]|nr:SRPBCC family protein [Caulobacteraceae bacterium]
MSDHGSSDRGQPLRVPAVRFERLLPGPVERVWAHLTEPGKVPAWYGEDGVIEPREGGRVRFSGGHIQGIVTQWKPGRRLAYTWNVFAPGETASPYPESYLTFELEPAGDQVRLTLLHLPILERFERQNMMGWHTMLDLIAAALAGEPARPRREIMQVNAAKYGVDLENLAR